MYAIKVVRKRDTRRKNSVQRVKTERQVLATAAHPFVVRLFYSFQSAHNLYMVMEFVNGGETPAPSESVPPEFDRFVLLTRRRPLLAAAQRRLPRGGRRLPVRRGGSPRAALPARHARGGSPRPQAGERPLLLSDGHTTLWTAPLHTRRPCEQVLIHSDGHIKLTDFGLSVFGLAATRGGGADGVSVLD